MDGKKKPHPKAEAEEAEMMDEPAPKKPSRGAMDDEFDLMGGQKPKQEEAPPSESENIEISNEDQTLQEDKLLKKKKKKHHKKKKEESLV